MSNSKHWVFTLNNYTVDEENHIKEYASTNNVQYLVYGREQGVEGTPHLQGYVVFTKRCRLATAKRVICSRGHFEQKLGTPAQAADYCKKDGDYIECGEVPGPSGSRSDLDAVYERIKEGCPRATIADEYKGTYLRYKRSIDAELAATDEPRDRNDAPEVVVNWGATGTGKTRSVWDGAGDEPVYSHAGDRWFDGYTGQRIALFDDFDGGYFKLSYFLKLLDRYPFLVPIKGGFVQWKPTKIFITSNKAPEEWYAGAHSEHQAALFRRFTQIKEFTSSD